MQIITAEEVQYLAFRLARQLLSFDEPIPDFETRFGHTLESCLAVPFQKFSGRALYRSLVSKAAMLFYLMIKNHPFANGNKRIAITTLCVFLHKNKKWLKVDQQQLYNFTVWVAQSPAEAKDHVVKATEEFLQRHLIATH
jgi:death-on-curing family protein